MSIGLLSRKSVSRKPALVALGVVAGIAVVASLGDVEAQQPQRDVIVTIRTVKALEKLDAFSKADFFAKVTIAGEAITTPVAKQADQIAPNWVVSKRVAPGRHNVRIELFDKDLTKSEPIDINRVANKRQLDFTVNTRGCTVGGFAQLQRCGDTIVRGGLEAKKAEIAFTVDVR